MSSIDQDDKLGEMERNTVEGKKDEDIKSSAEVSRERRFELIARKFSLTGGNAHYMFDLSEDEVEKDIAGWVNQFKKANYGSNIARDHLISRNRDGKVSILSRYVMLQCAKEKIDYICQGDWKFHLSFFIHLYHDPRIELTRRDDIIEFWDLSLGKKLEYRDLKDICGPKMKEIGQFENKLNIENNDWLIPTRWTEGCFDAIQILPNNILRVVHITDAIKLSLKLKFIVQLVQHLQGMKKVCYSSFYIYYIFRY